MNIKVQCGCGARYSFDVEPVNAQMPCAIACPKCGADGTAQANQIIQQNSVASSPAPAPTSKPTLGLRVASTHTAPPPAAPTAPPAGSSEGPTQFCSKHPRSVVESQCYVCGKPICMDCMQIFGYLCSATCRYQAEQRRIQVPLCEFQKSVSEAKNWQKIGSIGAAIVASVCILLGTWLWYIFSGSHPKVIYTWHVKAGSELSHVEFIDADHMLLVDDTRVALHDIKEKKDTWRFDLPKDSNGFFSSYPRVHVTADSIWLGFDQSVVRLDRNTGEAKSKTAIAGGISEFKADGNSLVVMSRSPGEQQKVTRIDLGSGEAKTEEFGVPRIKKLKGSKDILTKADPTEGVLLNQEFSEANSMDQSGTRFIVDGSTIDQMDIRLVEAHFNEVQSIKPKTSTVINENLSAGTAAAPVAEEVFNDIARSRGGGYKKVDESRYAITIRHGQDGPEFHGEVTGAPGFYPLKTVDVLTGGKTLILLDKQGKKIAENKLAYAVDERFTSGWDNRVPCFEAEDTVYFFDQGTLAAFSLPSGEARWRVTTVNISSLQLDGHGGLYVCTTTASPEDIQYSDQIKLANKIRPELLKIDTKTGKILWKAENLGVNCFLSGKYVYASNQQVSGPALALGLSEALGSSFGAAGNFRLTRLNPSNGGEIWDVFRYPGPAKVDFKDNEILMEYRDRIDVMKFFSF